MINATDCGFFELLSGLNQTNSSECGNHELGYEKPNSIVVGALFIICTWIILTNSVVVICFVVSKSIKKNLMNVQVLSLSFTDFLVGFSSLVLTLNYQKPRLLNSYGMCTIVFGFYVSAQIASFYHTFCICLHRFITVFCRLKSSKHNEGLTIKSTMIQVLIVWLVVSMFAFMPFFVFGRWGSTLNVCSLNWLFLDKYNVTLSIWNISLLAPQIVINIMYISIYLKLRRTWTQVMTTLNSTVPPNSRTNESVSKEQYLFHETKFCESKSDGILKVPQHQLIRPSNSNKNSLQQKEEQESALPDNRSGAKDITILNRHANLPSGSRLTVDHDKSLDSVDKSSNEVNLMRETNLNRQSFGHGSRPGNNCTKHRNHSKILVTVGLVLIVVDICLTPLNLLFMFESLHEGFLSRKTKFLIVTFSLFNSGINPIIYAFRIKQLRQSVKNGWHLFKTSLLN